MKFRFFLLMLLPICMVGCNDEMDSLVKGPSEVAELPKRSTSMMILQNYTIIGL